MMKMKLLYSAVIAGFLLSFALVAIGQDKVYTLEDAYQAALGSNEIVKIAEEDVTQSGNRLDQAWTYFYPRLVAKSAYTRFNETLPPDGGPFIFQPTEQFQAALVLTQPLYTGGRTLAALRAAQKMREASRDSLSVTKQDTLLKTAEAYYGVLKAQKSIEISRRSLERMEHHQQVTEREAATRKTKTNVSSLLRAKTLVSQARISLIRAQDRLKIARERLNLLTRLPKDALVSEPVLPDQPGESLETLQTTALNTRDDYAGSKLSQSIATENVTIVKGAHHPQIYAEGGVTYQDSRPATALDATVYYGGLRLQIPIFEGGLMKAEVSEANSKVRQAQLATDYLRKSIESEVQEAYVNLETVSSVLDTAKLQLDYAKGNYDAVEGLFGEGLAPSLSLIDAEQALDQAENEFMTAGYDRQVANLKLKKSIGMLRPDNSTTRLSDLR
jgi:outer membrane protein